MKTFLVLVCLVVFGKALDERAEDCDRAARLYDDLKCKPILASPEDRHPVRYDCSHIEERAKKDEEVCHFHGKTYAIGERIANDEIYGHCKISCHCTKKRSGNMGFTCAILDCPEAMGHHPKPDCHFKFELDKCCNVGEACPPFKATCHVGDKTYHDGQMFSVPNVKCVDCVCKEGFDGKFEEPFCRKASCVEEVNRQSEIRRFCAPSYIKSSCCPFAWVCPDGDEAIVSATTPSADPGLKCKFGDKLLNVGDKFEKTHGKEGRLSCECRIPPYMTCFQTPQYPYSAPEF